MSGARAGCQANSEEELNNKETKQQKITFVASFLRC
jgi:hypothetical protein